MAFFDAQTYGNTPIDPTTVMTRQEMMLNSMTFGIELEILVLSPKGCFKDLPLEGYGSPGVHAVIDRALEAKGIPVTARIEDGRYSFWKAFIDSTLELTQGELMLCPDDYDVTELEDEIKTVLEAIRSLEEFGCLLMSNQSCGLHVHVGFGKDVVPLQTCKSVFQVATALERRLDLLHTTSRLAPSEAFQENPEAHFNAPLAWFHRKTFKKVKDSNVFQWLGKIETCKSFNDISNLFEFRLEERMTNAPTSGHNSNLNFDNCTDHHSTENDTGTIEFRQHEGTLDLAEIISWVKLTATLVQFCHNASDLEVVRLCARTFDDDVKTSMMLKVLGCEDAVVAFYNQKFNPDEHEYQVKCARIDTLEATLGSGYVPPSPQALQVRNTIDNFHRSKFLAVHEAIEKKLQEGWYGKPIKFDPEKYSEMERAFADHDEMLRNGRESILTARGVAFRYMAGLTVPWLGPPRGSKRGSDR